MDCIILGAMHTVPAMEIHRQIDDIRFLPALVDIRQYNIEDPKSPIGVDTDSGGLKVKPNFFVNFGAEPGAWI
ncbi:unnamed protein product [Lupinus luteus]|uniref:Uncharacterized protein n=1 Tax=Lupinus luteus TaxID=3873 RepID=A0AAV1Y9B4_LUPLU